MEMLCLSRDGRPIATSIRALNKYSVIPGGAVLDIYDALYTVGGIDHVLVRREQARICG